MKRKSILTGLLAILLSLSLLEQAWACTIFTSEGKAAVYAAGNEDWMYSIDTSMIITAGGPKGYGRVCFYNSTYIQAGMNEYGLFYDGASCPSTTLPYDETKAQLDFDLGDVVLASCASVSEVIEFVGNINLPQGFYDHLLFADSTGDSVVLEWMANELHIIRKGEEAYQLVTNFWLTDPSLGGYPCRRYAAAEELLKQEEATVAHFAKVLDATKQHWGSGGTLYSGIYDLTHTEVYVFQLGDMTQAHRLNLTKQLSEMQEEEQITQAIKDLSFDTNIETLNEEETLPTSAPTEPPKQAPLPTEPPKASPLPTGTVEDQKAPDTSSSPSAVWGWGLGLALFLLAFLLLQKPIRGLRKKKR